MPKHEEIFLPAVLLLLLLLQGREGAQQAERAGQAAGMQRCMLQGGMHASDEAVHTALCRTAAPASTIVCCC